MGKTGALVVGIKCCKVRFVLQNCSPDLPKFWREGRVPVYTNAAVCRDGHDT